MTNKKTYLFLFSIGPVQSFIAQARKTQDLYAGSKILSELSKAGLKAADPKEQIFPNSTSNHSVPNRFLCIIESTDPKDYGRNVVEKAVRDKWIEIAKPVLGVSKNGIREQIYAHLDINWAFVEIKPDYSDYKDQYENVERLLGAVKNARSFLQFDYQTELGEKGRKCSLDGERNVKFYRLNEKENKSDVLAKKLFVQEDEVFINHYKNGQFSLAELQPGEGLSAVSMVKRKFDVETFRSTADIAMLYSIRYLFSGKMIENTCQFRKYFDDLTREKVPFNAQLYFEENLTTNYFNKQGYSELLDDKGNIPNYLKDLRKKLEREAKEAKYPFLKYYAIIDFDGDNMGKWLSGENINDKDKNLKDFHQKLSVRLAEFAKEARKIVDKYGQTVYAGGDDFLGFVNLNYLFKAMQELRNMFKDLVNDKLHKLSYLKKELSFSGGVSIAHYKEPLSMVLAKAAAAQKAAKQDDKGGRNAFSIVASKHSGENHEAYFKWATDCKNVRDIECVVNQLISENGFSNTFIKSLNIEFAKLTNADGKLHTMGKELLAAETSRLLRRSFMGKKEDKKEESEKMTAIIMSIYDEAKSFDNFIDALNICDFLHRLLSTGHDLGELPKTEKELCNAL